MWTVFILYDSSLFARGLERLLQSKDGVEVVGVAVKDEEAAAQLSALKPDVIIFEGKEKGDPENLLLNLLEVQPSARVVQVSLADGAASLYAGRRWMKSEVDQLLEAIFDPMAFRFEETKVHGSSA